MTDRDRLIELFKEMDKDFSITCPNCNTDKGCRGCKYQMSSALLDCNYLERKVDYLLANGVVVPPCKVGDVVYDICNIFDESTLKPKTVIKPRIIDFVSKVGFIIESKDLVIGEKEFGNKIFLTKEEAEKKLKEREG